MKERTIFVESRISKRSKHYRKIGQPVACCVSFLESQISIDYQLSKNLFCHVPLKRDLLDWDWRMRWLKCSRLNHLLIIIYYTPRGRSAAGSNLLDSLNFLGILLSEFRFSQLPNDRTKWSSGNPENCKRTQTISQPFHFFGNKFKFFWIYLCTCMSRD